MVLILHCLCHSILQRNHAPTEPVVWPRAVATHASVHPDRAAIHTKPVASYPMKVSARANAIPTMTALIIWPVSMAHVSVHAHNCAAVPTPTVNPKSMPVGAVAALALPKQSVANVCHNVRSICVAREPSVLSPVMVPHANVLQVFWVIHSPAAHVTPINVQRPHHAAKVKCVLVDVASIAAIQLCAVWEPPVNHTPAAVSANQTLLAIPTICACHRSQIPYAIHHVANRLIAHTESYKTAANVIPALSAIRTKFAEPSARTHVLKHSVAPAPNVANHLIQWNVSARLAIPEIRTFNVTTLTSAPAIHAERTVCASTHHPVSIAVAVPATQAIHSSPVHHYKRTCATIPITVNAAQRVSAHPDTCATTIDAVTNANISPAVHVLSARWAIVSVH